MHQPLKIQNKGRSFHTQTLNTDPSTSACIHKSIYIYIYLYIYLYIYRYIYMLERATDTDCKISSPGLQQLKGNTLHIHWNSSLGTPTGSTSSWLDAHILWRRSVIAGARPTSLSGRAGLEATPNIPWGCRVCLSIQYLDPFLFLYFLFSWRQRTVSGWAVTAPWTCPICGTKRHTEVSYRGRPVLGHVSCGGFLVSW